MPSIVNLSCGSKFDSVFDILKYHSLFSRTMKSIIIATVVVVAILSVGGGFYFYQQRSNLEAPIVTSTTSSSGGLTIPTLEPLVATVTPTTTPLLSATSSVTTPTGGVTTTTGSSSVKVTTTKTGQTTMVIVSTNEGGDLPLKATTTTPAVQGSEYVDAYAAVASRYNAVGPAIQALQKTITDINAQYASSGATAALNDLIKTGEAQNAVLVKVNAEFISAINAFDAVNKKITNPAVQEKAQPIVTTGKAFSSSVTAYGGAMTELLAYRGVGDLVQLSAALTNTAKATNASGAAFVREMLAFKTYLAQWQK